MNSISWKEFIERKTKPILKSTRMRKRIKEGVGDPSLWVILKNLSNLQTFLPVLGVKQKERNL
jgi:hypothetical protein